MPAQQELPRSILPMLAKSSPPFDSSNHLFEVKWDGIRALALVDHNGYRLLSRKQVDISRSYPEFDLLKKVQAGTVLDGEIVVLRDGKPDFEILLTRAQARSSMRIKRVARDAPATFIVFDKLYNEFASLMHEGLLTRREALRETVDSCGEAKLVFSDGIVGGGKVFFEKICAQGLEGAIAKRLNSKYSPGQRTSDWLKIKSRLQLYCAIIGFVPAGADDFKSLILATEEKGVLREVGRVGSGFDTRLRKKLNSFLWSRLRPTPLVECKFAGNWVEPGLYCTVSYAERTRRGELRAPVFEKLHEE